MEDREESLSALFDDLEHRAEAAFAIERELEVADRALAEYATVTLSSRLMASVGREVTLRVTGGGQMTGTLQRVSDGWCVVESHTGQWLVRLPAVQSAAGLCSRSVPEAAWPVMARLSLRSALREISAQGEPCRILTLDGVACDVKLGRVGADFMETYGASSEPLLVRFDALGAVHRRH